MWTLYRNPDHPDESQPLDAAVLKSERPPLKIGEFEQFQSLALLLYRFCARNSSTRPLVGCCSKYCIPLPSR